MTFIPVSVLDPRKGCEGLSRGLRMRHRIVVVCSCLMMVAVIAAPGLSIGGMGPQYKGGSGTTSETWTLALFINGDNNLEKYWDDISLPSLLNLPANDAFTIVAFVDRLSVDGTEVVEISGSESKTVVTYEEKDFGSGETFQWFLEQVDANYASDKLAVVAWDHGYAWRYISDDDTSGSRITMPQLQTAIANAGVYIDVLAFDACNMASIEVIYQVSLTGLVGIVVASEESVPTTGFPYDLMLNATVQDPSNSPTELATDMVDGFRELYEGQTWASTVALSAVDVPALLESEDVISTWTAAMQSCLPEYEDAFKLVLREVYFAWCTHYHVDIADLGDTILADATITDPDLIAATEAMVAAVDGTVITCWGGSAALDSRGMTLWWGVTGDWKTFSAAYADVEYSQVTGWYDFLEAYN